jgi:hypothetical protein
MISELSQLAIKHGTDKWNHHWYTEHYHKHLNKFKDSNINLLEIGVGGYYHPDQGGASLRMWKDYFTKGKIFAIDIFDKSQLQEDRIKIFKGSQDDIPFLKDVYNRMDRSVHVIVDDGSHHCNHIIASFLFLFPFLDNNGVYIIEDTETSYWEDYGGSMNLNFPGSTINFFKQLIDGQNHITIKDYPVLPELHHWIKGISFYRNLIIIEKGENV